VYPPRIHFIAFERLRQIWPEWHFNSQRNAVADSESIFDQDENASVASGGIFD
jgi:hypothetical protein